MTTQTRTQPHFAGPDDCRACPYATPCVTPTGRTSPPYSISPSTVFDCVYGGVALQGSVPGMLDALEQQVKDAADARHGAGTSRSLRGGIANSRGQWFEAVLQIVLWNVAVSFDNGNTAIMKLPNSSNLQFRNLYEPQARGYLEQLFESLRHRGMDMQMSNPDFLCVTNLPGGRVSPNAVPVNLNTLQTLDDFYQRVVGQCSATSIPFVLTVKSSLRPDRRYQVVHEANVVKSLVAHLAGRFWNRDLYTGFYAMVAAPVSVSDRNALRNPATHTLVQVNWEPVPLLDEIYQVDQVSGVETIARDLLTSYLA